MFSESREIPHPGRGLRRSMALLRARTGALLRRKKASRDDNTSTLRWSHIRSSLGLQNFFEGALLFLIHRQQLITQVGVGWIHAGLRAQVVDRAVEHLEFLSIVGQQRRIWIV